MPSAPERAPASGAERVHAALRALLQRLLITPRAGGCVLAAAWLCLIWRVSSIPQAPPPVPRPLLALLHNFYHAPEFGLLTLWFILAAPRRADGWPSLARGHAALIVACVFASALIDELHQAYVPTRCASLLDILTNVVAGVCVLAGVRRLAEQPTDGRKFVRFLLVGTCACVAAAALSTWLPQFFPRHSGRFGI